MTGAATALASLRLTLLGMLGLALTVLATYRDPELATAWVALPLGVLAVNLLAALLVNPRFRTQAGLLVFHLCLLAVVVLSAVGLMTRFEGRLELTEGQAFTPGAVEIVSRGPWHAVSTVAPTTTAVSARSV